MEDSKLRQIKQQIIFSAMPITEKDFWLILIKYLGDNEIEKLQAILNLKTAISKQKRELQNLEIERNQKIKTYNQTILEKIRKKLENIIIERAKLSDQEKIENIRKVLAQLQ